MRTLRVLDETTISFAELRRRVPGIPGTRGLYKWTRVGLSVKAGRERGELVSLEFAHRGGMPVTSMEAYHRFQAILNGQSREVAEAMYSQPQEES